MNDLILKISSDLAKYPRILSKKEEDRIQRGKDSDRRYYLKNREKIIKQRLEYALAFPEKKRQKDAVYRAKNKHVLNAKARKVRRKNIKKVKIYNRLYLREWYKSNPHKRKEYLVRKWLKNG